MEWLTQNWFFILVLLAAIGLHAFGHGGHGGHSHSRGHGRQDGRDDADVPRDPTGGRAGAGHDHGGVW